MNKELTKNVSTSSTVIKEFECSQCGDIFKYRMFSKGKQHRNDTQQCFLLEEAFHMDDPFEESSKLPFVVGGVCYVCSKAVCIDIKCSNFYTKRFCLSCIKEKSKFFPKEILKDVMI